MFYILYLKCIHVIVNREDIPDNDIWSIIISCRSEEFEKIWSFLKTMVPEFILTNQEPPVPEEPAAEVSVLTDPMETGEKEKETKVESAAIKPAEKVVKGIAIHFLKKNWFADAITLISSGALSSLLMKLLSMFLLLQDVKIAYSVCAIWKLKSIQNLVPVP